MSHFEFQPTPIEEHKGLSLELGCNLFIKRDDLFTIAGGGSKARMLQYILYDAVVQKADYILTAGGPYSNFNRALALMCGILNLKMRLVIYDKNKHIGTVSLNKRICDLCEVEYVHCEPDEVKEVLEKQSEILEQLGHKVYYIWGGGKSPQGVQAYFDCIEEVATQIDFQPDIIFVPLGTGTTFSGLMLGSSTYFPDCQVKGISVARDFNTAAPVVNQIINEFQRHFTHSHIEYNLANNIVDSFTLGGYGCSSNQLDIFLKMLALRYGLILDNIYVGKALFGLYQMVKEDKSYEGKNILFINTGGIYNF